MKNHPRRGWHLILLLLIITGSSAARAQFSGSVGLGGEATNNVQSLDTTAPDQILLPALDLNYDWLPSAASKVTFSSSYAPNFYSINPALSYNSIAIGATGLFYLSNTEAIAEQAHNESASELRNSSTAHFESGLDRFDPQYSPIRPRGFFLPTHDSRISAPNAIHVLQDDRNDSLVDLATSALYTLSGQLDSTEISPTGLAKSRVQELDNLKDSISDALSTIADLLDSVGYSESAAQVIRKELDNIRTPLSKIQPHVRPLPHASALNLRLLDEAIMALRSATPEADFLNTAAPPMPTGSNSQTTKSLFETLEKLPSSKVRLNDSGDVEAPAPSLTLVTSATRLREFGSGDIAIRQDIDDSDAMTMATTLTTPISWSSHTATSFDSIKDNPLFGGGFSGNPNDNHTLALGAAIEGIPTGHFSLRGSYSYARAVYAFDSVYSNTEHRFNLFPRIAIGRTTVLFAEAALGFRDYINPLDLIVPADTVRGPRGKIISITPAKQQTAASRFSQYAYGLGISQFIGDRWAIGALAASNSNPNLRAYITNAQVLTGPKGRTVRAAVQVADDEYTYDLDRYCLFTNARVFWDIDLGVDLSKEHRVYGSAVGKNGKVIQQGRTENDVLLNASLSKLIPFQDRLFSMFNSLTVEAKLETENANSTVSLYSFAATTFTLNTSLGF
ncbi:MAG: hypothetical protein Q8922_08270 [Bacteroidota bacterium]|nr:hypothetical protein [Bacteroidota bacterium]MDP4233517.1 hypothetical protein [Bacteroidota bacterium]MDP4243394.1 hypothetical protein [Bacteroidota bacterium]MDP4287919.1 hypothetical protein [Bacteroidota bacterium]